MMATHNCHDGGPCPIPPHPDLQARLFAQTVASTHDGSIPLSSPTGHVLGLNDGVLYPESHFETPVTESVMANAALERAPLRGAIRSVV
jgi:immune inhibitor A